MPLLRKIDTSNLSTLATSSTSKPSPKYSLGGGNLASSQGEFCQSPDSLHYPPAQSSSPRSRRRDTSSSTLSMSMGSPSETPSHAPIRRNTQTQTQTRSDIPFIGGAFSSTHSKPSLLSTTTAKKSSHSTNRRGLLSRFRFGSSRGGGGGGARRIKNVKWIGLLCTLIVFYLVTKRWNADPIPRKKLTERWWEVPEDQLSPEDLSALLPKPTLSSRPPLPPKPPPLSRRGFTLSQILKLPTTSSARESDYTALIHLTTPSHLSPAHIHPLLTSLKMQSPVAPTRIVLLCPSGMAPPSTSSLLSSFGPTISIRTYDRRSPLLTIANLASSNEITTKFILFVNGRSLSPLPQDYVKILVHSFGTKEFGSSLISAGGLSISTTTDRGKQGSGDSCVFPQTSPRRYHDLQDSQNQQPHQGDSSISSSSTPFLSERISIPSTPFLFPVSWLLPRSSSSSASSSSRDSSEARSTTGQGEVDERDDISFSSPTVLQGLPTMRNFEDEDYNPDSPRSSSSSRISTTTIEEVEVEIGLSWSLWNKNGIPCFALPIPMTSSPRTQSQQQDTGGGGGGEEGSSGRERDGKGRQFMGQEVCETLQKTLSPSAESGFDRGTTGSQRREEGTSNWVETIRRGFENPHGAGEGLRRITGDRKKGGIKSRAGAGMMGGGVSSSAVERSREMRKGSLVLLLGGKDELDAVRKIACRFGAARGSSSDDFLFEGAAGDETLAMDDRELRVVVADWDSSLEEGNVDDELCHLEITPLLPSTPRSTAGSADTSISLPLIDMLDSKLHPAPAVVLYLSDGPRAREFEEVLKWMGGIFGVKKGGERLSRIRMEKESVGGGDGGKGRMSVIAIDREEAQRAEWIGALPIEALRHWHTPRIDVSVITNDRPVSLHRLLLSLRSTHYFGDDVSLTLNLEQTADRLTHRLVDDFRWSQGPLHLRHRILQGGLMPAIVESWYPASNDTYGVLLEDDVEVSPLFYGWLKFTILKYRYTLAGRSSSSRLFGVSLYQQKNIELRPEGRQPFDAHALFDSLSLPSTIPYLSQIPCSWGAAYFPEQWREFHSYLSLRLSEIALPISEPIVPAIRSNRWPKSWKKYFIELVYLRGYTMLYPNYPNFDSLSTNHLEKGTHVKSSQVEEKKKLMFEVPLMDLDGSLVDSLPGGGGGQLPDWKSLPVMDLWGSLTSSEELLERGWQTTRQIGSCQTLPDFSVQYPKLKYDARELLCKKDQVGNEPETRLVKSIPLPLPKRDDGNRDETIKEHWETVEQTARIA